MTGHTEVELRGTLPPSMNRPCVGYKETKVMWLSANVMLFSNSDVPITDDIKAALELIPELARRDRVDHLIEECAEWMRKKNMTVTKHRRSLWIKQK